MDVEECYLEGDVVDGDGPVEDYGIEHQVIYWFILFLIVLHCNTFE